MHLINLLIIISYNNYCIIKKKQIIINLFLEFHSFLNFIRQLYNDKES